MKSALFVIALLAGASCSAQPSSQSAIMRVIESNVQLPVGANALEAYSRNYAFLPNGKVIAVFVTPRTPLARSNVDGCEIMLEDFSSRPCTKAEVAEMASRDDAAAARFGRAGRSRWFDDYRDLPLIMDGGCDLIEIIFDPKSQVIESTRCNGEA